ncbi:hypothetical protein QO202_03900 [Aeromonas caviae]|uniref:hypothetical protein n=1 Tax=Aeromonas caviae TaxID=648 RepID=UPI002648D837|nr:hypothetical protein [Aeromonas caviae]MDN6867194.1 hypothetical protein [Aeromonas caviae]
MQIFQATLAHIEETSRLFDAYRQFYGQAPDRDEATRFIGERLQGGGFSYLSGTQRGGRVGRLCPVVSGILFRRDEEDVVPQ